MLAEYGPNIIAEILNIPDLHSEFDIFLNQNHVMGSNQS